MKVGRNLVSWDTSEIWSNRKEELLEEGLSEEEADRQMIDDVDLYQMPWEDLKNDLTEIIKKKNPNGYWKAESRNFGWRSQNGEAFFNAETGVDLLQKILPKTDCTFNIFNYGRGMAIQNFHHDSNSGREWYYLYPISELAYQKAKGE